MATVALPVRRAKSSSPRHGTCKLRVFINSNEYSLKSQPAPEPGARRWSLAKRTGDRSGSVSHVTRVAGFLSCSCPDHQNNKFSCKHVKALVALGLLSGRKHPAPTIEAPRSPAARATAACLVARAAQLGTAPARQEGGAR